MPEITNTQIRGYLSPKIGLKPFQKAFEKLPYNQMRSVKMTLMQELCWSISTFQYKKRGDTPIRENEITVIENIFEGYGIQAWTGERI